MTCKYQSCPLVDTHYKRNRSVTNFISTATTSILKTISPNRYNDLKLESLVSKENCEKAFMEEINKRNMFCDMSIAREPEMCSRL